jgi:hypothetical protein
MPINNAGQYTYGVPQNNGYYSSGYGTLGAGNPYISGGPGYIGSMNNTGGSILPTGGLLSNSAKVQSNPGFDDSSGLPIHTSHVTKQDGTPEMTSSFYFNQAQEPGQSVDEWKNMSPFDKAQIHENAARLAMDNGDIYSARRSMDVAERLRTGTPDWANPEGGYKGLPEYGIIPGDQRGLLNNTGEFGELAKKALGFFVPSVFNVKDIANSAITNVADAAGYNYNKFTDKPIYERFEKQNFPDFDPTDTSTFIAPPASHSAVVNAGDDFGGGSGSDVGSGGIFDYVSEPTNTETEYDYWGL